MLKGTAAIVAALGFAAIPAFAAMKAPDAQMHFKAIASAKLSDIMSQYTPGATLHWIGGPLNGTYTGSGEISGAWSKFIKLMGKTSEKATDIKVAGDPRGMTVTANVTFMGHPTVPVRYILVYRGSRIVDEVWQIDAKKGM